jgi:4-oxalomesaconate tautomerase
MLVGIPCVQMRGGTSKGLYFLSRDLPQDDQRLAGVLLAAMGSPDTRQIDGVGGGHPLTSKVAIVSKSSRPGIDVDYRFAQVLLDERRVEFGQNCGNILAGVGPFAIEQGLVAARGDVTRVSIHMVNSAQDVIATVQTPNGQVNYQGDCVLHGVPGTAAPIRLEFPDTAGSACGVLLPTGRTRDIVDGIEVTCIDNGMPCVILRARDLDITGYESCAELERNEQLKARIEAVRLTLGPRMNLAEVAGKTIPKMVLVAPPRYGGVIHTRSFIPHKCHTSIGVLGAVSVATACLLPGTVTEGLAQVPSGRSVTLLVEHPAGTTGIEIEAERGTDGSEFRIVCSCQVRTARKLFAGQVFVPASTLN